MGGLTTPPDPVTLVDVLALHRHDPCAEEYRFAVEWAIEHLPMPLGEALDAAHEAGLDVKWAADVLDLFGDGYGFGYGDGNGYGCGYGDGFGYGFGCGYGDGDRFGYGFGYGFGCGYGDGNPYGSGFGYGFGDGDDYLD